MTKADKTSSKQVFDALRFHLLAAQRKGDIPLARDIARKLTALHELGVSEDLCDD